MNNLVEQAQLAANRTRVAHVIYNSPFGGQCFARKSEVGNMISERSVVSTVYPKLVSDHNPERAKTETCTVEEALEFATHAHKGQIRTLGRDEGLPYVTHCVRVASALWPHKHGTILALIHDVLEDVRGSYVRECPNGDFYLFANDRILHIAAPVAKGLELLTRKKGKRYQKYIEEIAHSECVPAIMVKREDLADNLRHEPNRSLEIRYRRALEHLERKADHMKAYKLWPTLAT